MLTYMDTRAHKYAHTRETPQLHQIVYEDTLKQEDAEAISLASLNRLEELHMKLMFHILRQLGRGAHIHEKIRVLKTEE